MAIRPKATAVCTETLSSGVVMMKSAQDCARPDYPDPLNRSRTGRILIQGQVRSRLVIVANVRFSESGARSGRSGPRFADTDGVTPASTGPSSEPRGRAYTPDRPKTG